MNYMKIKYSEVLFLHLVTLANLYKIDNEHEISLINNADHVEWWWLIADVLHPQDFLLYDNNLALLTDSSFG